MRRRQPPVGCFILGTATALVWGLASRAETPVSSRPGVVLHETHTQSSVARVDTLHTYFTPGSVLIVHGGGRTLLDLKQKRIVVFDAETGDVRTLSLEEWEAKLGKAEGAEPTAPPEEGSGESFEAQGSEERIAGFRCERYHSFGRSSLLGDEELVERQIWVTQEIEMPMETYEVYRSAFDRIESFGGAAVQRPAGVVLAVETRTRLATADRRVPAQVERYTVYAVERRDLPDSLFQIPMPASHADSAGAAGGATEERGRGEELLRGSLH